MHVCIRIRFRNGSYFRFCVCPTDSISVTRMYYVRLNLFDVDMSENEKGICNGSVYMEESSALSPIHTNRERKASGKYTQNPIRKGKANEKPTGGSVGVACGTSTSLCWCNREE